MGNKHTHESLETPQNNVRGFVPDKDSFISICQFLTPKQVFKLSIVSRELSQMIDSEEMYSVLCNQIYVFNCREYRTNKEKFFKNIILNQEDSFPKPSWVNDFLATENNIKGKDIYFKLCPEGKLKQSNFVKYLVLLRAEFKLYSQIQDYLPGTKIKQFYERIIEKNEMFRYNLNFLFEICKAIKEGSEWWNDEEKSKELYKVMRTTGIEHFCFVEMPGYGTQYRVPYYRFHLLVDFIDHLEMNLVDIKTTLDPRISYLQYSNGTLFVMMACKLVGWKIELIGTLEYSELLEYFEKHKKSDKKNMKFKTKKFSVSNFDMSTLSQEIVSLPSNVATTLNNQFNFWDDD